jgi:hypothetical protein
MIIENGYKIRKEKKKKILYCRMDDSMIAELNDISAQTGISVSELLRNGARELIARAKVKGSVNLL